MSTKEIKTIGILTHKGLYNYGGLFQAYALLRWLGSQGFDVEIINIDSIEPSGNIFRRLLGLILRPINTLKKLFSNNSIQVKSPPESFLKIFTDFKIDTKMRYSSIVRDKESFGNVVNRYDAIIVGSDQVWCYKSARPLLFFIHWKPLYKGYTLAYAACSPDMDTPWYNKRLISKQLLKFNKLSVRDVYTKKWVESLCGRSPLLVADPTLLYDFKEFDNPMMTNEPYIFAYCLGSEICGGHKNVIDEIRKHYGVIKVIGVTIPNLSQEVEKFADEVIYDASPQKWFNLLKYASFVYTDSFHGCMFSLKYKKQFIAYYSQQSRASRLIDIKNRYNLDNAIISSVSELHEKQCIQLGINYDITNQLLEKHIEISKTFLSTSLHSIDTKYVY